MNISIIFSKLICSNYLHFFLNFFNYTFSNSFYKIIKSANEWIPTIEKDIQAIPVIDKYSNLQNLDAKDRYQVNI